MMSADLFAKLDDKPKETRILTRMLLSYIATKNFSKALTAGMRILRVTDDPALKRLTEMRIATIKGQMEGKDTVTTTGGRGGGRAFQSQHARRESNMARIKVRLRVCVCATRKQDSTAVFVHYTLLHRSVTGLVPRRSSTLPHDTCNCSVGATLCIVRHHPILHAHTSYMYSLLLLLLRRSPPSHLPRATRTRVKDGGDNRCERRYAQGGRRRGDAEV